MLHQVYVRQMRNDFYEMAIHHLVTIALICTSHGLNWTRIGCLVLFVHDVSDIGTYVIKAVVDMDCLPLTAVGYISCLGSWFYLRLWVLPFVLIRDILKYGIPVFGATVRPRCRLDFLYFL